MKDLPFSKTEKYGSDDQGFTLIEVLVAAAIIIFGLVMYAVVSGNIMTRNAELKQDAVAMTLAQDKLEGLKEIGLTADLTDANGLANPTFSGGTWSASSGDTVDPEGNTGTSDAIYTRTWTLTANATGAYFTDILLTVSWASGAKSVSINTRVSQ